MTKRRVTVSLALWFSRTAQPHTLFNDHIGRSSDAACGKAFHLPSRMCHLLSGIPNTMQISWYGIIPAWFCIVYKKLYSGLDIGSYRVNLAWYRWPRTFEALLRWGLANIAEHPQSQVKIVFHLDIVFPSLALAAFPTDNDRESKTFFRNLIFKMKLWSRRKNC